MRRADAGPSRIVIIGISMGNPAFDYHAALRDPAAVYGTPERILADPRLDAEGRRAMLREWESQIRSGKHGAGKRPDILRRIRAALAHLEADRAQTARRPAWRTDRG